MQIYFCSKLQNFFQKKYFTITFDKKNKLLSEFIKLK